MNGIVGLLERRGRTLERDALAPMMAALSRRPHEGLQQSHLGCVALGAAWIEVASGDGRCATPASSANGRLTVVVDGRLYYHDELDRTLWGEAGGANAATSPCGDAARIMGAPDAQGISRIDIASD